MKIGSIIKYLRTTSGITQEELSFGICSIPHLSKIENNRNEANTETLQLLLGKLGFSLDFINSKDNEINLLLQQWINNIHYFQKENALGTHKQLQKFIDYIPFSSYLYLYELYKFRYMLFGHNIQNARIQKNILSKQKINFSKHERCLFDYYSAILLILEGKNLQSSRLLEQIESVEVQKDGEFYYHLSLVKGHLQQSSHSILYGKKALQYFCNEFNFKRILHTLMLLGISYTNSNLFKEAQECYKHLLRNVELLDGDEFSKPMVYQNFGYLLQRSGELEKASYYLEKSKELFPPDSEYFLINIYSLANTYYRLGDLDKALHYFKKTFGIASHCSNQKYLILSKFYTLLISRNHKKAYIYLEDKVIPYLENLQEHLDELKYFKSLLFAYHKNEGNLQTVVLKYINMEVTK